MLVPFICIFLELDTYRFLYVSKNIFYSHQLKLGRSFKIKWALWIIRNFVFSNIVSLSVDVINWVEFISELFEGDMRYIIFLGSWFSSIEIFVEGLVITNNFVFTKMKGQIIHAIGFLHWLLALYQDRKQTSAGDFYSFGEYRKSRILICFFKISNWFTI